MTLKSHSLAATPPKPKALTAVEVLLPEIERLSESELGDLRHEIDLRLHLDLSKLDLSEELALQFRQVKALLHEIQNDSATPVNQKSQLFNSARGQLSDIIRQQEAVWSMERLKTYEVAFVKCAHLLTEEARAAFFDLYGTYLKDIHAADPAV